jgi:hypothetical protein
MDLQKYKFEELNMCQRTDKKLLIEAKSRDFYNGNTPYNALFGGLFFGGGKLNFKKDIPEDFRKTATQYLKAFMGSFEPKHEEKEAICAMLLSELVDI